MDDEQVPAPLDDEQQTQKDTSYSPSSERETEEKQSEGDREHLLPGTGGPDDSGDVEAPPEDLHMPDRGDPE